MSFDTLNPISLAMAIVEDAHAVLRFRIKRDLLGEDETEFDPEDGLEPLQYWLGLGALQGIHGRQDAMFENVMAKLLLFGLDRRHEVVSSYCDAVLQQDIWGTGMDFEEEIHAVVAYPFLVHAGYEDHPKVAGFLRHRLQKISRTIARYGYEFASRKEDAGSTNDVLVFAFRPDTEALPTIYDLYAWAFVRHPDADMVAMINRAVLFLLDERFREMPKKGYVKGAKKRRLFAAGSVYHAADDPSRLLLYRYLLSHFNVAWNHPWFQADMEKLLTYQKGSLFVFPKPYLKEQRDSYMMYSGAHMGLGEPRRGRDWVAIESTFWMALLRRNKDRYGNRWE
jgi:hypothetical protein